MPYKDPAIQREYSRKWKAARRAAFFKGKTCVVCHSAEDLELDHINPAEKVHHDIWSWSADRQAIELAKCQVLCHDCHLQKTIRERSVAEHGTQSKYTAGCRCTDCKEGHRNSMREWRLRGSSVNG